MTARVSKRSHVLLASAGARACAIPLQNVLETMRPLPFEPVAGAPRFVRGVSVIRGAPTPVIDLAALLEGDGRTASYGRFVTLAIGERRVAIGVDAVAGVRSLDADQLGDLPPLLRDADAGLIQSLGVLDAQLLVVLRSARLVTVGVWKALDVETPR